MRVLLVLFFPDLIDQRLYIEVVSACRPILKFVSEFVRRKQIHVLSSDFVRSSDPPSLKFISG